MIRPTHAAAAADVARHYDELDGVYRQLWGEHLHHGFFDSRGDEPQVAAARLVEKVAEVVDLRAGMNVCDVGCGYGATARMLVRVHGVRVEGLTLSRAQFEYALASSHGGCPDRAHPAGAHAIGSLPPGATLRFHHGDWLRNSFADGAFDVVIAIECLTHMPDQAAFFREVVRVLRPGGRVAVCAWLTCESPGALHRRLLLEPICREGELAGMASASETRALISEAGLEPLDFQDLTHRVRRTWTVAAGRLLRGLGHDPELRRLLRNPDVRSRVFARTLFRIWAAYRLGAMRYGLFLARRPLA